jgi:hypothetical protein
MFINFIIFTTIFTLTQAAKENLPESICSCGKFIDLKSSEIDMQPLNELLSHPSVKGRRLYTVGYYGETDVLSGIIVNELYENVSWKFRKKIKNLPKTNLSLII